jgi:hypothetical protein
LRIPGMALLGKSDDRFRSSKPSPAVLDRKVGRS